MTIPKKLKFQVNYALNRVNSKNTTELNFSTSEPQAHEGHKKNPAYIRTPTHSCAQQAMKQKSSETKNAIIAEFLEINTKKPKGSSGWSKERWKTALGTKQKTNIKVPFDRKLCSNILQHIWRFLGIGSSYYGVDTYRGMQIHYRRTSCLSYTHAKNSTTASPLIPCWA